MAACSIRSTSPVSLKNLPVQIPSSSGETTSSDTALSSSTLWEICYKSTLDSSPTWNTDWNWLYTTTTFISHKTAGEQVDRPGTRRSRPASRHSLQACWDIQRQDWLSGQGTELPPRGGFSVATTSYNFTYIQWCLNTVRTDAVDKQDTQISLRDYKRK